MLVLNKMLANLNSCAENTAESFHSDQFEGDAMGGDAKLQHWGTYSVRDHIRPRAFVADVLLFDKLVIPRPATEKELLAEGGQSVGEDQMKRWRRMKWKPERQRELLDILGEFDLAIELPWGVQARQDWRTVYRSPEGDLPECTRSAFAQSIHNQVQMAGFDQEYVATGGALALYVADELHNDVARKLFALAKTPGVPVEPVIAYGAYSRMTAEQGLKVDKRPLPEAMPASHMMFGWELFVPEDTSKSGAQLLREAAKLASRPDFIEARQSFHGWLKQMYSGEVDSEMAKGQMLKMLREYTAMMRKTRRVKVARYAAKVVQLLAPLAGLAGHTLGVAAGVTASAASLTVEQMIPIPQMPPGLQPAAMLYDARKFFGKR